MTPSRYSRQAALAQWGEAGQRKMSRARALLVGLGGLGNPAATYLASAGLGHLVLNDFDTVDVTNLARQPLYTPADIGAPKVAAAAAALKKQNPDCEITIAATRLAGDELSAQVAGCEVVLDGSDNLATRFALNEACVAAGVPLVSGAVIRYEGQLGVFRGHRADEPCYRCLHDEDAESFEDCAGQGVLGPLAGVIGTAMALEATRVIVGFGTPTARTVLLHDARTATWRRLTLNPRPGCPTCARSHPR